MDWFKITLTILVLYSLFASFFVRKTKTVASCILLSGVLAIGSVFVYAVLQECREPLESAFLDMAASLENLYQ